MIGRRLAGRVGTVGLIGVVFAEGRGGGRQRRGGRGGETKLARRPGRFAAWGSYRRRRAG